MYIFALLANLRNVTVWELIFEPQPGTGADAVMDWNQEDRTLAFQPYKYQNHVAWARINGKLNTGSFDIPGKPISMKVAGPTRGGGRRVLLIKYVEEEGSYYRTLKVTLDRKYRLYDWQILG